MAFAADKVSVEFCLGADNPFKTAKTFQMGPSNIGDKAEIWLGYLAKGGNFAWVVGAHLYNCHLGIGRDGKEGEGHPEVVVEIALGGMGVVATR